METGRSLPARTVEILPEPRIVDPEQVEAGKRNLQQMIQEALTLLPNVPPEVRIAVLGSVDAVRLAYFLGSILTLGVEEEQKMLEATLLTSSCVWPMPISHANWRYCNCGRRSPRKRRPKWTRPARLRAAPADARDPERAGRRRNRRGG